MAPAGTPKEIIARLSAQGLTVRGSSPEELGAATREQLAKYARLMKQTSVTIE